MSKKSLSPTSKEDSLALLKKSSKFLWYHSESNIEFRLNDQGKLTTYRARLFPELPANFPNHHPYSSVYCPPNKEIDLSENGNLEKAETRLRSILSRTVYILRIEIRFTSARTTRLTFAPQPSKEVTFDLLKQSSKFLWYRSEQDIEFQLNFGGILTTYRATIHSDRPANFPNHHQYSSVDCPPFKEIGLAEEGNFEKAETRLRSILSHTADIVRIETRYYGFVATTRQKIFLQLSKVVITKLLKQSSKFLWYNSEPNIGFRLIVDGLPMTYSARLRSDRPDDFPNHNEYVNLDCPPDEEIELSDEMNLKQAEGRLLSIFSFTAATLLIPNHRSAAGATMSDTVGLQEQKDLILVLLRQSNAFLWSLFEANVEIHLTIGTASMAFSATICSDRPDESPNREQYSSIDCPPGREIDLSEDGKLEKAETRLRSILSLTTEIIPIAGLSEADATANEVLISLD